jgi:acyl-CoA dehydrogenase
VFAVSDQAKRYQADLLAFMDECVYPAEAVYEEQMRAAGDPHHQPAVIEELKAEARRRGLWNLFHPHPDWGPGLTNFDYAPLAEIMGRSHLAPEACNCAAPDTGNMEVLTLFGSDEHKERYLKPLLEGTIRSAFAMTEPAVASSDATGIQPRMERNGDWYVLNGRKWFASNVMHKNCRVLIVMGKTDPAAAPHRQQSMMVVPLGAPGLTVLRSVPVFGYQDREGHAELDFSDVRVPAADLLAGEGEGFAISQARLGPGRIHHCMRTRRGPQTGDRPARAAQARRRRRGRAPLSAVVSSRSAASPSRLSVIGRGYDRRIQGLAVCATAAPGRLLLASLVSR